MGGGGGGVYAVAQMVEALRYKPEGRGLDFRRGLVIFHWFQIFRPHCGPGDDR
jgi:hypothetical protein